MLKMICRRRQSLKSIWRTPDTQNIVTVLRQPRYFVSWFYCLVEAAAGLRWIDPYHESAQPHCANTAFSLRCR